jgi:predicted PurR-regulated permease PerM
VAAGLVIVSCVLGLLELGQAILMPVITALLAIYVVRGAAAAMARVPLLGRLPEGGRGALALLAMTALILLLSAMLAGSLQAIVAAAPVYEDRIEAVIDSVAGALGMEGDGLWEKARAGLAELIDIRSMLGWTLGSVGSIGSLIFMAVLYATFMLSEREGFARKIGRIFGHGERSEAAMQTIAAVNERVTTYLGLKTFINIVLGGISYVVLVLFGVDFALLWALLIGLLNYIPYIGSYLGVAFPVILAIAQFGNLVTAIVLAIVLSLVQMLMGNFVEPKLMGRSLNLSPFVIVLALAVWSALWGIPGAILAVPMTAVIAIVAAGIPSTRWIAILLSDDADAAVEPETRLP